jgi:hypothetical protein
MTISYVVVLIGLDYCDCEEYHSTSVQRSKQMSRNTSLRKNSLMHAELVPREKSLSRSAMRETEERRIEIDRSSENTITYSISNHRWCPWPPVARTSAGPTPLVLRAALHFLETPCSPSKDNRHSQCFDFIGVKRKTVRQPFRFVPSCWPDSGQSHRDQPSLCHCFHLMLMTAPKVMKKLNGIDYLCCR